MWFIRRDCCGLFSAIFTIGLMVFAATVQIYYVLGPWKGYMSPMAVLYVSLVLLAALSHTRCHLTDPGSVPVENLSDPRRDAETDDGDNFCEALNWCQKCRIYKPFEASHCSCCQRCVVRMDHHCPWTNNCVALVNQKYFLQFLLFTGTQCVVCLMTLAARFVQCNSYPIEYANDQFDSTELHSLYEVPGYCEATPLDIICCILNFIEAILFGLFTFIMLFDQISAIFSNTPYIASLKGRRGAKKDRYECLKDVFGEAFCLTWFLPTPPTADMLRNHRSMCITYFGH